ncbi:MAG: membrane protein [Patescibacteria group bacterium]|nr:MAG: membrane protein [Patescibacteria group bacterium]
METVTYLLSFIIHLDKHIAEIIAAYGPLTYLIFFGIVFAETGLVIFPFLPGDSLLFAAGTFTALGSLHFLALFFLLWAAAVLGDSVNYWIGNVFGQKLVDNPKITFINQEHIDKTEEFYRKYGGKTIILARFVPIVRTFAPFVAGVGKMDYQKFFFFNVVGGFVWVALFMGLGYFFGNVPIVKENFAIAIFGIIGISVIPMVYEYLKERNTPSMPQKVLEKKVNK